jgi:hypothetical protein
VAQVLAEEFGWTRLSEDDVWRKRFHKDRGVIGTEEHRRKRLQVRKEVVDQSIWSLRVSRVVIDAIVHEADPESIEEYEGLFAAAGIPWEIRVLHPRLDVAVQRDATRLGWTAGAAGVEELWRKFSGQLLAPHTFIDTSDDTPRESASRVLSSLETSNELARQQR